MDRRRIAPLAFAGAALASPAWAHTGGGLHETRGELLSVTVDVGGRPTPLYRAPDGSGRYYLEARQGCRYAVTLANRTGERLGVVLTVDGLNAISGERDSGRGRMYVLDPWQRTTVRGWRTSLREVRRFTFVDEQASYAARSGKANEKMGWIEIAVYRERRSDVGAVPWSEPPARPRPAEPGNEGRRESAPAAESARDSAEAPRTLGKSQAQRYPGTGWGPRAHDPVVLVSFDPEGAPGERVTLRYEYRPALVALGVLPPLVPSRDRLWERDHAEPGFAQPPSW